MLLFQRGFYYSYFNSLCALGVKLVPHYDYDPVWLASVENYNPTIDISYSRPFFYDAEVEFRLFTRERPFDYEVLETDNSSLLWNSTFDMEKPLKILVHGWYNNGRSPMPEYLKEAYLNASDVNVLVIDWEYAANVNYIWASYNVGKVGRHLTMFVDFLVREGMSLEKVHMVGHSLGAHVVGIAGAFVEAGRGKVHTITGLDPALPLFTESNRDARLDKHDAQHVEVIHTCGGYLGFSAPIGHMDFYPNGGSRQPGCGTDFRGFCAHNRAHRFFLESIISDVPFIAVRCLDYEELRSKGYCNGTGDTLNMGGYHAHFGKEGIYYLETNAEPPFAKQPEQ